MILTRRELTEGPMRAYGPLFFFLIFKVRHILAWPLLRFLGSLHLHILTCYWIGIEFFYLIIHLSSSDPLANFVAPTQQLQVKLKITVPSLPLLFSLAKQTDGQKLISECSSLQHFIFTSKSMPRRVNYDVNDRSTSETRARLVCSMLVNSDSLIANYGVK